MPVNETASQLEAFLRGTFSDCDDFTLREMIAAPGKKIFIAYIGNLSDRAYIAESVIKPLVMAKNPFQSEQSFFETISSSALEAVSDRNEAVTNILSGSAVIFADTQNGAAIFAAGAKNDNGRSVDEPDSEVVVRGPREGFIESGETNVALLRKRIKTPDLKVKKLTVGTYTETVVSVVYIKNVADENALNIVTQKLESLTMPGVVDSGDIEHYLEEVNYPFFSGVGNSEKPDKIASKLLEGRIAVICDGSPVVLTVPYLFVESLQSTEDYLKNPYYATFIRFLRLTGMFLSLYLPAIYITLLEHHKGVIPFELYQTITKARREIPFSVLTELITVLLIFELIREVGLRIPRAVGDAVSIVGGLILGDAAIKAGITSAPVILVASLTAISSFINPPYMNNTVLLRLFHIVLAKLLGIVGITFGILFLLVSLCRKTSYGVPYLAPFAPIMPKGLTDSVLLLPKDAITRAPNEVKPQNYNTEKG